ncbi:hypothetical protein MSG28_006826 [Choristoneura fumiferana]|uniref:Uncharacterized protein n=1 Tax=Choristoneura fumiferana TaxID=7141 RepID=A0ACC0JLL2_CHOFU|nr:hypothetical protein MSG28_006826 [Choristoneura fumiferana]
MVRHTLALLLTTSAAQAAGVAYAQPGERRVPHVAALSAAALANGVAMVVCYVIRDEECLRSAKRALRQSTPDSRADIVRCVEYKDSVLSPHRYERHPTRAVCDLIPRAPAQPSTWPESASSSASSTPPRPGTRPLLTCSVDFEPYTTKRFDTAKENCTLCVQSNPDVSKIPSPPIKSCLKKSNKNQEFTSSISLPSMEVLKDEPKSKSDIEQVNASGTKRTTLQRRIGCSTKYPTI